MNAFGVMTDEKLVLPGFFLQKQAQTQPLPHYSPPQWDTSTLPQAEFQPFSQPRSMTDPISWSVRSNPPPFQLGTPTSQFLFGSPKPDKTEAGSYGEHSGPFILNQRKPEQPTLEFPRSHSEPLHLFEEEDFPMFNEDKHGRESAPFGDAGMQYLREESSVRPPSPQTVPNPQASGMELFHCSDTHSSCLGENAGLLESFEYSPSCSCRGGYPSSDSNDDEPYCESCPQEPAFYSDEACCSDGRKSASQRITVLSPQQQPLTPLMRSKTNVRGTPNMMLNEAITDTASGGQQTGTFNAPFSSPRPIAETQSSEICRCKKMCSESQDVGTQTAYTSTADTRDASTQCSFVENTKTRASGFPLLRPAVDASQQFPANERESEVGPQTLRASSKGPGSKDGVALLSWKKPKNASGGVAFNNVTAEKRLIKPVLGIWSLKGEENGGMRERTGPDENNPLVREVFDGGREEVTSAGRGHTLSEEEETLREIADVLLLMKQRRNDQE
ncbi:PREDICTED: uncharacterized protein LOC107099087 isoform X1 [Cyprinodon variegatus]|uniref:uncharacterized protein LOC107099087 isoform X1 n=2 Tax=Cyprinodon variegatus TaxID=28743 RepID=UPI00074255E7|nr:PREDICTED: uncharacterized protein LOC107099087 isoform X1 [Cyprinodon variegatus]